MEKYEVNTLSDRFYNQQLKKLGDAPGHKGKRKQRMAWTDEKKEEVVAAYLAAEPTADNSLEIVKEIAEDFEESPNGVRMILIKANVYVKKGAASKAEGAAKSTRVSKQASQDALSGAIRDTGHEVDEEIISKLTGKAAQYLAGVIIAIAK